jgi:hypothetical protein
LAVNFIDAKVKKIIKEYPLESIYNAL